MDTWVTIYIKIHKDFPFNIYIKYSENDHNMNVFINSIYPICLYSLTDSIR